MALTITGLSKTYPNGVRALKNVSLTIGNSMFGLLGPNGAGKSSLMRTIATLQDPDSGAITLDGIDVLTQKNEVRQVLGYLPQEFGVYPKMSAIDMLDHLAVMKGITVAGERKEMVDALLQQTNLWDVRKKALSHLLGRHEAALRHRAGAARQSAADHRRRAHRRPRSRRAQSLPQSARLDRPRRHGDPLHAHRRRRARALPAHGDHRARRGAARRRARRSARGARGTDLVASVVATDDELRAIEARAQGRVQPPRRRASTRSACSRRQSPGDGFRAVPSGLEDVYFLNLSRQASQLSAQPRGNAHDACSGSFSPSS